MTRNDLPVVVIGGGPVGLAAAAHLARRGRAFELLEAGQTIAASVRRWGHVGIFSPWRYNVDPAAAALLAAGGWTAPPPDGLPTGHSLIDLYLDPLSRLPQIAPRIRLNTCVVSITRDGYDKMKTTGREDAPFIVQVRTPAGSQEIRASAVIDASGTYATPNPIGGSGVPAIDEEAFADRIFYGVPDLLGKDRRRYASRRVMVVGSGHSAFDAILDLADLANDHPDTHVTWVIRRADMRQLFGGEDRDMLPARGALGTNVRQLLDAGKLELVTGFRIARLTGSLDGVVVESDQRALEPVDEIIGVTGFRPDLSLFSELRVGLDPSLESPTALAPLIDPNVHSCGTVPPHGEAELRQPEPGFYVVGMKSYGRAPTFLMATGYEQVRSVVAAIDGDMDAARSVELFLPETGVCASDLVGEPCCGAGEPTTPILIPQAAELPVLVGVGSAPERSNACCG